MTQSAVTKLATFVAAPPGKPIPTLLSPKAAPEERGRKFLDLYGTAFGVTAPEQVQLQRAQALDEVGMEHVRFQQVHRGVPVRGGEIIVHLRGAHVTAATAKTLPDLEQVATTPIISPQEATVAASGSPCHTLTSDRRHAQHAKEGTVLLHFSQLTHALSSHPYGKQYQHPAGNFAAQ